MVFYITGFVCSIFMGIVSAETGHAYTAMFFGITATLNGLLVVSELNGFTDEKDRSGL